MRAVTFERYGPPDVLRVEEVATPEPAEGEVLVRVHATTASRTDAGLRSAEYWFARAFTGVLRPKSRFIGLEFAGVVEATGAGVTQFAPGDRVFGIRSGSNAEFVCVREAGVIARIPEGVPFEAALADGALSALSILNATAVPAGARVAVYGASGSIGTAAVQVAKHLGLHVTGVCDTKHVDLVRSLGADAVVDYTRERFPRGGEEFDLVFDAVGKSSFVRMRCGLRPGGTYVSTDLGFLYHGPLAIVATRWLGKRKAKLGIVRYRRDDVVLLAELLASGRYRAVIDSTFALEDIVAAHRRVDSHQKTGNVVVTVTA